MSFIVAANWKMNKSPEETKNFFSEFFKHNLPESLKIIFFVPSVNASVTARAFHTHKTKFSWGPQNIHHKARGAFTGETSPQVMRELGAEFVLVGHSERRQLFYEKDEQINLKIQAAIDFQMVPILCIGESLDERKADLTTEVLKTQLEKGLKNIKPEKTLHIAYEPVWAIGTGEMANPPIVEQTHDFIRKFLENRFGGDHEKIKILYGGSVKAANASSLWSLPQVGGFLVGGASLEPESFLKLIRTLSQ